MVSNIRFPCKFENNFVGIYVEASSRIEKTKARGAIKDPGHYQKTCAGGVAWVMVIGWDPL
jgi:hypothetical protein